VIQFDTKMYICPKCNVVVEKPTWNVSREVFTKLCPAGHKLRERYTQLAFLTDRRAIAFFAGALIPFALAFGAAMYNNGRLDADSCVVVAALSAVWCWLHFRADRRLRAVGPPASLASPRFRAGGYGVLSSATLVIVYILFRALRGTPISF
jgi:hypothetical protein